MNYMTKDLPKKLPSTFQIAKHVFNCYSNYDRDKNNKMTCNFFVLIDILNIEAAILNVYLSHWNLYNIGC